MKFFLNRTVRRNLSDCSGALALSLLLAFPFAIQASGCADSATTSGGASGSAPTVRELAYSPTEIKAGAPTTVTGTFVFEDAESDVSAILAEVTVPGGQGQSLPRSEIPNGTTTTSGTLSFALLLQVPAPTPLDFTVRVIDRAGHESNRLTGRIEAK